MLASTPARGLTDMRHLSIDQLFAYIGWSIVIFACLWFAFR